jgi:uncharacterized membrane protein YedE/YeeE
LALVFWWNHDFHCTFIVGLLRKNLWNVLQPPRRLLNDGCREKSLFFDFDWKAQQWNLIVSLGVILGEFFASNFIASTHVVAISQNTVDQLVAMVIDDAGEGFLPKLLFSNSTFSDPYILLLLVIGGFLVGFGALYAGSCTSGHAISGLSNMQLPSLIAVIGFFIGGLLVNHFILPLVLKF